MTMSAAEHFDLVVIGSGPAGEKGAAQAAYFGKKVAVVERAATPGGAAVGNAGIPTKTLRETALYVTGFQKRDIYGVSLQLDPQETLDRLRARRRQVTEVMTERVRANIDRHNITYITGEARLLSGKTVTVDGHRELTAEAILLATGSRPFHPPAIPFDDHDVHDSETILEIDSPYESLVVIGGGAVGCEYASIFAAIGSRVTLIDQASRVLPFLDAEMSEALAESFRTSGIELRLDAGRAAVERIDGRLTVTLPSGETLFPDGVLAAAGRAGNTESLGLEEAGIEMDDRRRIKVDETYQTTAQGVYAAGDVIGPPALASASMEQGRVAACYAFGIPFKETVDPLPPFGVYTMPEVAMVGMTEAQAEAAGIEYEVGRGRFSANARANIAGLTEGLVKLVFRRDDKALLGVHILGDIASEMVHLGQAVLHFGGTIDHFIHSTFNVPTFSEAYKYAAYDGLQRLAR